MSWIKPLRVAACCLAAAFALLPLTGCGPSGNPDQLDRAVADESLKAFLEAWKAGQTPADLKNRSPSIIVGNVPEFERGTKLESYQIGEGKEDGTNLHAQVELTLAGGQKQEATYVVGTSPVITIFPP